MQPDASSMNHWISSPLRAMQSSCEDFVDYGCFGVGVVLHVFPCSGGKFPLSAFVRSTVCIVGAQPVSKYEHLFDFRTTIGIAMEVDIRIRTLEHAVFVETRFAYPQGIARSFESRHVGFFIRRIGDDQHYIDYRLGGEVR